MRQQRKKWRTVKAWFGKSRDPQGFLYERGRYVAHNRDVRNSPTHSELLSDETHQATASQRSGDSSYLHAR